MLLTDISCSLCIKESDVLFDHALIEVFLDLHCDSFTQCIECGSSQADTGSRKLNRDKERFN